MITDMNIVLISELFDLLVDEYPVESAIRQALIILGEVDSATWANAYLACINAAESFLLADYEVQCQLTHDPSSLSPCLPLAFPAPAKAMALAAGLWRPDAA